MTLQQRAEQAVRRAVRKVRDHDRRLELPEVAIDFSLRGRCAGQARLLDGRRPQIRINLQLLADNLDDYLQTTIPHEIAHLAVSWHHRRRRHRPRPHGPEWQAVMRDCFGLEPVRCHSYATTPARRVPRNYLYLCDCREHRLTRIMHNRIGRAGRALCRSCHTPLTFKAQLE